ncbi:S locus-related glycoprotein 1 binding pollen coat [Corchorus capsularis]|uniref:S locus-related glycoprotein 1 binding pollen coat n=1 Tax=Corchorus capsularis TaxID=210143 RepID=A0A1R3G913_COCAP|nr:S locus-related glycoprotein 1 binding pollen coat [Corchorus capsularis]
MAKLSRNIVMVLFATLLVTTLMMFKGVEGQEICHVELKAPGNGICDAKSCKDQCAAIWNGSGLCVQSVQNLFSCNCSFPCGSDTKQD